MSSSKNQINMNSSSTPLKQKNVNVSIDKEKETIGMTKIHHDAILNNIQITTSSRKTEKNPQDTIERSSTDQTLLESTSPSLVRAFLHKFITVEKKMTVNNFVFKAIKVPYPDFQTFIRYTSTSTKNNTAAFNNNNMPNENAAQISESEKYIALARQTATFASTVKLMKTFGFFHNHDESRIDIHQARRRQRQDEEEEKDDQQQQSDHSETRREGDVAEVITPTFSSSALNASRSNMTDNGGRSLEDNIDDAPMMGNSDDSSMTQINLSPSASSAAGDEAEDDDDDEDDDKPFITLLNSSSEKATRKRIAKSKSPSLKNKKSEQAKIASSFLLTLTEHAKSVMLPEELVALQNGEGQADQVEKMRNSRLNNNNKENVTAAVECDKEIPTVSDAKCRIVAPLGTVPIYDDCDQVRQKLEVLRSKFCATFLLQLQAQQIEDSSDEVDDDADVRHEQNAQNKNLDQTIASSSSSSVAVMCKAIAAVSGRVIHGSQWKRFFDKRRGPFAGAESIVYADGYLFLEKLRVYNGEPKSRERLENEKRCDDSLPGFGFERIDETRRTAMKVVRRK